jgi:F-type H+-transporting ATPase subunit b
MPQLDLSTFTPQLFWLAISFATLYLFTARVTMPRIQKILETRRMHIESSLLKADELEAQAGLIRQEFEAFLSTTRNQAHDNVMQMINKVAVTSSQRKKDLNSMMVARIQSSEAHILRRKTQALDDIKDIAQTVAAQAVEKLIDQKVDPKAVGVVMNELFRQKVA